LPVMKITTRVTSSSFEIASFAPGRWTEWVALSGMTNGLLQCVRTCERERPAARSPRAPSRPAAGPPSPAAVQAQRNARSARSDEHEGYVPAATAMALAVTSGPT
jgi:hypothetical protein